MNRNAYISSIYTKDRQPLTWGKIETLIKEQGMRVHVRPATAEESVYYEDVLASVKKGWES